MGKSICSLINISKSFNQKSILNHFSLDIEAGTMIGISGDSGCGKSTLLYIASGLLPPDSGEVFFQGINLYHSNAKTQTLLYRQHISFALQHHYLLPSETISKNLEIPLRANKIHRKNWLEYMNNALQRVHLDLPVSTKVCELSGGEQQRLAMARAIIRPFDILFCDEPTSGLDDKSTKQIMDLFLMLKNEGKTIVVASHKDDLLSVCNFRLLLPLTIR